MKKLIAGNWKMNGTVGFARALVEEIAAGLSSAAITEACDFAVFPPFVHLMAASDAIRRTNAPITVGGQDCSVHPNGAFTGDTSVEMLKDLQCHAVLLGHSERRQHHGETDEMVAAKAVRAHAAGLHTIICVGETDAERSAGHETDVVNSQLHASIPDCATAENCVIAYEPVWAIGTGKVASPEDVRVMHKFIREKLTARLAAYANMRILYGGSVKPDNAGTIFAVPNVDGALIGGASLKASDFLSIARAA